MVASKEIISPLPASFPAAFRISLSAKETARRRASVKQLLEEKKKALQEGAKILLEREVIGGDELKAIIAQT